MGASQKEVMFKAEPRLSSCRRAIYEHAAFGADLQNLLDMILVNNVKAKVFGTHKGRIALYY